jgi:hypothetical protein
MLWGDLLTLSVAAALLPVWVIITLFLLRSEGGLGKASAFLAGATAVRLLQGVVFGFVFGSAEAGTDPADAGPGPIVATLLLLVGILMLVAAFKKWRKEEDPDESPKWMEKLTGVSTPKAFGMGALLMTIAIKQWVFTLTAIAIIERAGAGVATSIFAFLVFVVIALLPTVTPIIAYAIAPQGSARILDAFQAFLQRHNRVITIAVSLIFGVWFVWKGVTGLIG